MTLVFRNYSALFCNISTIKLKYAKPLAGCIYKSLNLQVLSIGWCKFCQLDWGNCPDVIRKDPKYINLSDITNNRLSECFYVKSFIYVGLRDIKPVTHLLDHLRKDFSLDN